jgi:hypothetical protein
VTTSLAEATVDELEVVTEVALSLFSLEKNNCRSELGKSPETKD